MLAVLAYTLYNNLLSIFQAWTAQGKMPTWVGLWPVHFAVIALLVFLLSRQMVSRRLVRVRAVAGLARGAAARYNFGLPGTGAAGTQDPRRGG